MSRASSMMRRVRDSLVTRAVYLLGIFFASSNLPQKLFESHVTIPRTVTLLSTNTNAALRQLCLRRVRDSNPWNPLRLGSLVNCCFQPLSQLSIYLFYSFWRRREDSNLRGRKPHFLSKEAR